MGKTKNEKGRFLYKRYVPDKNKNGALKVGHRTVRNVDRFTIDFRLGMIIYIKDKETIEEPFDASKLREIRLETEVRD